MMRWARGDHAIICMLLCAWNRGKSLPPPPNSPEQVGFFTTDHWFDPCPTVARAVREAAEGLRAAGHEVVPFEPPVDGWEVSQPAPLLLQQQQQKQENKMLVVTFFLKSTGNQGSTE